MENKDTEAINENAATVFGDIDPEQDWNSINSNTVTVTANANLADIVKVQILTESPFLNPEAKVLSEKAATNGQTVTLSYDAPNAYSQLIAACVNSKGNYYIQVFDANAPKSVSFTQTKASAPRSFCQRCSQLHDTETGQTSQVAECTARCQRRKFHHQRHNLYRMEQLWLG